MALAISSSPVSSQLQTAQREARQAEQAARNLRSQADAAQRSADQEQARADRLGARADAADQRSEGARQTLARQAEPSAVLRMSAPAWESSPAGPGRLLDERA